MEEGPGDCCPLGQWDELVLLYCNPSLYHRNLVHEAEIASSNKKVKNNSLNNSLFLKSRF